MAVIDVDASNWEEEVLNEKGLVIVEFWHDQCHWCKVLEPVYFELAEEMKEKAKFTRLNVLASEENFHLSHEYGIMGTPTIIFFCEGRPIASIVGYQPKEHLKHVIEDVLAKHKECVMKSTKLEQ